MKYFRRLIPLVVILGIALLALPADATLVITTTHPSGSPLVVMPGMTSTAMTVSVFDPPLASAVPADNLTGWQFRLAIMPQGGSMGTLTFNTPATGAGSTEPSNYVLPGTNFGINVTNTSNQLFAFDFDSTMPTPTGTDVPDSPGNNLLDITFSASMDAAGVFDIVALAGGTNTNWTDPAFTVRAFNNVPLAGGNVVIGQVNVVAIPEAGAFAALALVSAVVGAWQLFKRRLV